MRFEHPHLLWLLPLLPSLVLLFLWWSNRARRRLLEQFIQSRLLPELTVGISTARQRARALLFAGAAGLIVIALARPQWGFSWEEARHKGLDIVVAIDTSKSMLAEDIKPNRLARAKLAALDLMQQARADRLGLVAFAGGAFLQCPLTLDDGAFRQCIDELNVNIIPQGGTALAEAIRTATAALKDDDNFKVLVMFTDGEDHDPGALEAATEASKAGMRIFTIGLGTEQGEILRLRNDQGKVDYVRDAEGQVVKSRLNESILQQIAGAAQGFYLPLRGADTVDTLYEKGLAPLPKSESGERLYQRYHEQFHWPLGLAILLLLLETVLPERKREPRTSSSATAHAVTAALVGLLLLSSPAHVLASTARATRAFETGDYAAALEEFDWLSQKHGEDPRLQYNAGTAAYRAGQYDDAITRYGLATGAQDLQLQQQAYYNRGNALYRAGEQQSEIPRKKESWQQAVKDYEAALKLNAADQDAQFNLDFVKKRLEELEQQQQENQQDQKDKQDQEDKQDKQNDQNSNDQQQQDQQQQDQQSKQDSNDNQQENSQGDQQDQQKNDQQDRDRQEPSDQEKQPSEQGDSPENPNENPQSGQDQQGRPTQPSNMTPEQAARLLDNLKGEEQMLPVRLTTPQSKNPPAKDW
ncbi:MAG: VWA domain-containing protein [Verrucomicrobia bacterium]|nr:VWA domain-containing protein [Verrucomicrobiota bacterium]